MKVNVCYGQSLNKKAFTLIELLAVIVILAIIALIAVPIVLNIIKDSKEESNKRSIEMYAKALKNSIAKYQLDGKELGVSILETTDGRNFSNVNDFKVDYDGNVACEVIEIYADGTMYLEKCEVNGELVKYTYGKKASFTDDSWATIAANVKAGYMYNVGDTREVSLQPTYINQEPNSGGLYTVRIANISSDDPICKNDNYSKTACGFVVEFVDIITTHKMNSTATNVGGYPASEMYNYIKNEIYNSLPKDLRDVIIDTKVVSSHGSTRGETNFTSEDKLYLLSTKEVWGKTGTINVVTGDTAEDETRQLDYYKDVAKVTTSSYSRAKKIYKDNAIYWWLRSAGSTLTNYFYCVLSSGEPNINSAASSNGVSVAFRIG